MYISGNLEARSPINRFYKSDPDILEWTTSLKEFLQKAWEKVPWMDNLIGRHILRENRNNNNQNH